MILTLKRLGLGLVFVGAVLLAVLFAFHITMVNLLLIVPLCLIVAGVCTYVWGMKRESRY